MKLTGKHAIVTGGGRGIGAAIADALSAEGARVTLMGRSMAPLQQMAAQLTHAQAISIDVTRSDLVHAAFQQARESFGPVDILINNAGQAHTSPAHKMTDDHWSQMIAANLNSVFYCCREALTDMRNNGGGRIVNIASTAALKGYTYVAAYCAAKHGTLGLTRSLALENASRNITVNAVCPGYTETELLQNSIETIMEKTSRSETQARAELAKSNPQGHLVQPEQVSNAVVWLCAPGAEAITGQAIAVAGGEIM
ncbi:MAG TPA: 3-hydroxyacyl-CoA dehydrogenase [Spongiibacteraceae bacterium]|nr:3-hydroxyacyl-CoA dehydrogenase [Spongiibacteraceae bacterium]HCS28346.1 3-hydroxyacyl-CoA dehydrogenase [Spongiibacteraceae bacterium]|tara:strand:- start:2846 stop:3607 length:762 start_codon:yes stop_codon:yes gene_type:complete